MEMNKQDCLEELVGHQRVPFTETNQDFFLSDNDWRSLSLDCFHTELEAINLQNSFFSTEGFSGQVAGNLAAPPASFHIPFADHNHFRALRITDSSQNTFDTPPFSVQFEDCNPLGLVELDDYEQEPTGRFVEEKLHCMDSVEEANSVIAFSSERKHGGRGKQTDGQPSKNLMAERRRRKRLNDRLSMLRSIVPNMSKTDRISILRDTTEYMKKLLERIKRLQQADQTEDEADDDDDDDDQFNIVRHLKSDEMILMRNLPKLEVERSRSGSGKTRIEMCCGGKPGLLESTVNTLEALGLEIEECVISCFNDFTMQASCSDHQGSHEERREMSCEDIKQELFANACYGGSSSTSF